MKKYLKYLFFISTLTLCSAQENTINAILIDSKKVAFETFIGFDGMQSLYYINNNVLYKKDKNELWQYKNISLGKISKIDILNPLKIVLFYENFNTVILLDNQLNEIKKINFSEKLIPLVVSSIGISSNNQLWVYNSLTQQIGLYNYLKNNYKTISPPISGTILFYQTDFNTFYWIDNQHILHSCDLFGKINDLGKIPDFDQIQLLGSKDFIFSKDSEFFIKDEKKTPPKRIENLPKSFKNFFIKDQILSIFTTQEITNFKITKP